MDNAAPETRIRAFVTPRSGFTTSSYAQVDSRLSFGHVSFARHVFGDDSRAPKLFKHYLTQQIGLLK